MESISKFWILNKNFEEMIDQYFILSKQTFLRNVPSSQLITRDILQNNILTFVTGTKYETVIKRLKITLGNGEKREIEISLTLPSRIICS